MGPRPVQAGGPPILSGSMGPKSMARASKWGDGYYSFAMDGDKGLTEIFKTTAEEKWSESGREGKPVTIGGFWYSLADNAEQRLKEYVRNYLLTFGEQAAAQTASTMTRFTPEAIEDALIGMKELDLDEVFMVPTTPDIEEIDHLENLLVKTGFA